MNMTGEHLDDIYTAIAAIVAGGAVDASTVAKGIALLSVAPAVPTSPKAVGDNDPRVPTADPTTLFAPLGAAVPTGAVVPYTGDTAPSGYVLGDGSVYEIAAQPALAAVQKGRFGLGTEVTATFDNTTDVITAVAHGLANGTAMFLKNFGGALPTGLSPNTLYYVVNQTVNTFQLSATLGGAAINFTTNGTGTNTYSTAFKVSDLRGVAPIGVGTRVVTFIFDATVGGVNTATDSITVPTNTALQTGQPLVLSGAGLPTGLTAGTYYVIRVDATTIKLATSVALAQAGTAVDITAVGTGTATLTQTLATRSLGEYAGEETHAMTPAEMIVHHHSQNTGSGAGGTYSTTTSGSPGPGATTTGDTGGNTPMNNMQPSLGLNFIIKT